MALSYLTIQSSLDATVSRKHKFGIQLVSGTEAISRNFFYDVRVSTLERLTDDEIDLLVGDSLTIEIKYKNINEELKSRFINGIVFELKELGNSRAPLMPQIWRYELKLSSWFKTLDYSKECRIFQKAGNTSMSIVSELFQELGYFDFKNEVRRKLPQIAYSVLYNESVGNYIRRMIQADGIIWRFEHTENKHILVFSDDSTSLPTIAKTEVELKDSVNTFQKIQNHVPIKECTFSSYNWENQPVNHVSQAVCKSNKGLRHFEYTGNFPSRSEGESKARQYGLARKGQVDTYKGESTIRAFEAGKHFSLLAPMLPDLTENSFLIKNLKIKATKTGYVNEFEAIKSNCQYVLQEKEGLKKPRVLGLQTAIVVGAGGNGKVKTDKLGRVKVRFHWDHHSPPDDVLTSAFIRVAMPSAGTRKGYIFNPRIGEEVVVDFEDGDPDKPIIIGCVYSKNSPPPINPASQPFTSMIKNSPLIDSNQIVIDDKPGNENIEIVAKKDMKVDVTNDFNIDVVNKITITAKNIIIIAKNETNILAGKDIENRSLATIIDIGVAGCINTAGSNIVNVALGSVSGSAGAGIMSKAGALFANTSASGINQKSDKMVADISKLMLANTGKTLVNAGTSSIDLQSKLSILNKASETIINKTDKRISESDLMSTGKASGSLVTGDTEIGP